MEAIGVTLLPMVFLTVLFGGGARMLRHKIDMDGTPPMDRRLFYAILFLWAALALRRWSLPPGVLPVPGGLRWSALGLWSAGFGLLLLGRWSMGSAFRIGSPGERTVLTVTGLFRYSRNPMYLGVDVTALAASLYTLSPLVVLVGLYVAGVHHRIVLAEERYLGEMFGEAYHTYCRQVRHYL